jgi:hypothetical protein
VEDKRLLSVPVVVERIEYVQARPALRLPQHHYVPGFLIQNFLRGTTSSGSENSETSQEAASLQVTAIRLTANPMDNHPTNLSQNIHLLHPRKN